MPYQIPHSRPTTPREAIALQESLRDRVLEPVMNEATAVRI